jgi:hypothetical protein
MILERNALNARVLLRDHERGIARLALSILIAARRAARVSLLDKRRQVGAIR